MPAAGSAKGCAPSRPRVRYPRSACVGCGHRVPGDQGLLGARTRDPVGRGCGRVSARGDEHPDKSSHHGPRGHARADSLRDRSSAGPETKLLERSHIRGGAFVAAPTPNLPPLSIRALTPSQFSRPPIAGRPSSPSGNPVHPRGLSTLSSMLLVSRQLPSCYSIMYFCKLLMVKRVQTIV
jgi:hypothetical protein